MRRVLLVALLFSVLVGLPLLAAGRSEPAAAAPAAPAAPAATVEPRPFNIISHEVHRRITAGAGGDIITPWVERMPQVTEVSWTTMGIQEIHDRLFREAAARTTNIDVGYIMNALITRRAARLLEPLDEYLKKAPIEGWEGNFPKGMLDALSFDGKLYAIPVRSATHALGWNQQIFAERGLTRPPRTPEEFEEYARRLTFTRADGTRVYGYAQHSQFYYTAFNSLARMWDGGFITEDFRVIADSPGTIKAMEMFRRFYVDEIMPRELVTWGHAERQRAMQAGQVAMGFDVFARLYNINNPAQTSWGSWKAAPYPLDPALQGRMTTASPNTEFWAMAIPANARDKDLAWEYIRYISSHANSVAMALNGNGPTRLSVFEDEKFRSNTADWDLLLQLEASARIPLPGFDRSSEAAELIDEYIERGMLGDMPPAEAMRELARQLRALSPELR